MAVVDGDHWHWHEKHAVEEPCMVTESPPSPPPEPPRARILHMCGSSLLAVARKACQRAERIQGPIGSLSRKLSSAAAPIWRRHLLRPCRSLFSFGDDRILAAEGLVISAFPSSVRVFRAIDRRLELIAASLPEKFDSAMDCLESAIHRAPVVGKGVYFLNCLVSVLADWPAADERVIGVVNVNYNAGGNGDEEEQEASDAEHNGKNRKLLDEMWDRDPRKEEEGEGSDGVTNNSQRSFVTAYGEEEQQQEEEDHPPILELLDEGWHSTPATKPKPRRRGGAKSR